MLRPVITCLLAGAFPFAANAAILNATPTNLLSVFAAARDGDTIMAAGTFGSVALQNRVFTTRVTLDATSAIFADTLTIQNVTGLTVLRGTFGSKTEALRSSRAVAITKSSNIKFQNGTFIGNGATAGSAASLGLTVSASNVVQISAGRFSNFKVGLGVLSSTNVKVDSSRFTAMTSDGINIVNSRFVTATANTCVGTVAFAGAHPDCIQLWSVLGNPVQSDVALVRNIARDATQGFTSFNVSDGGGLRISMIGNTVAVSYPQGIACYACFDSVFTDNVLTTLPGSLYQTSMNIIGGGNNKITNNSITRYIRPLSADIGDLDFVADGQEQFLDNSIDPLLLGDLALLQNDALIEAAALVSENESPMTLSGFGAFAEAVPEPGVWAQLILGFGLVGAFSRRRVRAIA